MPESLFLHIDTNKNTAPQKGKHVHQYVPIMTKIKFKYSIKHDD